MTLFKKAPIREWDEERQDLLRVASTRVHKMNSDDLCMWADNAASGMMRAVEDYMEHEYIESLEEMTECVIALQAVVMTLRDRLTYSQR